MRSKCDAEGLRLQVHLPHQVQERGKNGKKDIMRDRIIIGIDPDVGQSGIGRLDYGERKCTATHLPFPLLVDYIRDIKDIARRKEVDLIVYVEASWLISHNWHIGWKDTKAVAAKKGQEVGRMHETGRKIMEMLQHYDIDVREQHPLKKAWRGKDGKITHEEITQICRWEKKRSNQEERDAMLIAWYASGLPIRITVK